MKKFLTMTMAAVALVFGMSACGSDESLDRKSVV